MAEYRSSATFLGLPLFHFATGGMVNGRYRRGVASGWVAIGDIAFGALFATGGVAVGGVSFGGVALGLLPIGGFALGLLAVGGCAVGYMALGGGAFGWYGAAGGLAVAREYAVGGAAYARTVIAPSASGGLPFSSIPHPPFRWADAAVLIAIVLVLLRIVTLVRNRGTNSIR
jgi:hypothetical protein